MGIAYTDAPNPEAAEEVIRQLDGAEFKERKLRVRPHVPYTPGAKLSRMPNAVGRVLHSRRGDGSGEHVGKDNTRPRLSDSSVFVRGLKSKTSEEEMRQMFSEFNPVEVKVVKRKGWIKGLRNHGTSAIITFQFEPGTTIDDVIEKMNGLENDDGALLVVRAYDQKDKEQTSNNSAEGTEGGLSNGSAVANDPVLSPTDADQNLAPEFPSDTAPVEFPEPVFENAPPQAEAVANQDSAASKDCPTQDIVTSQDTDDLQVTEPVNEIVPDIQRPTSSSASPQEPPSCTKAAECPASCADGCGEPSESAAEAGVAK